MFQLKSERRRRSPVMMGMAIQAAAKEARRSVLQRRRRRRKRMRKRRRRKRRKRLGPLVGGPPATRPWTLMRTCTARMLRSIRVCCKRPNVGQESSCGKGLNRCPNTWQPEWVRARMLGRLGGINGLAHISTKFSSHNTPQRRLG